VTIQIFPTIVVVVPGANSLPHPVAERPAFAVTSVKSVVIVVIEMVGGAWLPENPQRGSIHDENIGPAVVVRSQRWPGPSPVVSMMYFWYRRRKHVHGRQPCFFCDVDEIAMLACRQLSGLPSGQERAVKSRESLWPTKAIFWGKRSLGPGIEFVKRSPTLVNR